MVIQCGFPEPPLVFGGVVASKQVSMRHMYCMILFRAHLLVEERLVGLSDNLELGIHNAKEGARKGLCWKVRHDHLRHCSVGFRGHSILFLLEKPTRFSRRNSMVKDEGYIKTAQADAPEFGGLFLIRSFHSSRMASSLKVMSKLIITAGQRPSTPMTLSFD